ncbi:MAG: iron-sulfur cluster assembly scaffold protein, partial [Syntrophobacteraceae bacterium]
MSNGDIQQLAEVGEYFLQLARQPRNIGSMENPSGKGKAVGTCGDSVEVFLQITDGKIADIRVAPRGCIYTLVCASAMSEIV